MRFILAKSLESTQTMLTNHVRSHVLDAPFLVIALNQTNGIGSRSNAWEQVSCGLHLSCALPMNLLPKDLPKQSTSIYFGQILLELFQEFRKDLWLKWPNDFYLNDYKVGGLVTHFLKNCVVFGIGLNILSDKQHSLLTDRISDGLENKIFDNNFKENGLKNADKTQAKKCESLDKNSIKSLSQSILFTIIQKILHFLSFNIVEFDLQNDIDITTHGISCKSFLHDSMTWCEVFRRYEKDFHRNYRFSTHIKEDGDNHKVSLQDARLQQDGSIILHDRTLYSLR